MTEARLVLELVNSNGLSSPGICSNRPGDKITKRTTAITRAATSTIVAVVGVPNQVEIKSTATQETKTQYKNMHKNTNWVLNYISTIMGMENKSSPVAWVVVGNTIVTRGWILPTWEATSVGSAWNPHGVCAKSFISVLGHSFHVVVDQQGAATTGTLWNSAGEQPLRHNPSADDERMARSIDRSIDRALLRKLPTLHRPS